MFQAVTDSLSAWLSGHKLLFFINTEVNNISQVYQFTSVPVYQ